MMSQNLNNPTDVAGVEVPRPTRESAWHLLRRSALSVLRLGVTKRITQFTLFCIFIFAVLHFFIRSEWRVANAFTPSLMVTYLTVKILELDLLTIIATGKTREYLTSATSYVACSFVLLGIYDNIEFKAVYFMEITTVFIVGFSTFSGFVPSLERGVFSVIFCLVLLFTAIVTGTGQDGPFGELAQLLGVGGAMPSVPTLTDGHDVARGAAFCFALALAIMGGRTPLRVPGKVKTSEAVTAPHLDELTGARSRKWVLDELSMMITTGTGGWLILLDIDRFARINNTLGFEVGDKILRMVAGRGTLIPGANGSCARIGADVFALVLSEEVDIDAIRRLMSADVELPCCGRTIALTMCVGARRVESKWSAMDTLRGAGLALQIAKSGGRGRLHVCVPKNCVGLLSELDMEIDLRAALAGNEFVIHYQPIVRMNDRKVAGFEALLRWRHPERGIIPPNEFIPVLEQTGLIIPVGAWVLKEAASTLKALQVARTSKLSLFMSVNVSPAQLRYPDVLRSAVQEAVALCGPRLRLEVTESMIIDDPEAAAVELAGLRKLGADLSLDDFGTGHSSLSVLHRLPFQTLKLDRSILRGLQDHRTQTMIKALINMANDLNLAVVAEGIEKDSDADLLSAMGCTYGQGYRFGRPLPMDEQADLVHCPH